MMFEVYNVDVDVNGEKYRIRPLSGRFLPKLYGVLGKLSDGTGEDKISLKNLNEENMAAMHELILETFKKSYPSEDVTKLDEFVGQNLIKLIEPIIKVNLRNEAVKN